LYDVVTPQGSEHEPLVPPCTTLKKALKKKVETGIFV